MSDSDLIIELEDNNPAVIKTNDMFTAVAFNLDVLDKENPKLAKEIRELYDQAKHISASDKIEGHEEDIGLVSDIIKKQLEKDS
jgi:hypothetical protein